MSDELNLESCQRCGDVGQDRRSLWMSCFYAMEELGLPLEEIAFHGQVLKQIGMQPHPLGSFHSDIPKYEEPSSDAKRGLRHFYTLRVCKDCRASWMAAIKKWFNEHEPDAESPGTGIFVRRLGQNVEVTEEEFHRMRAEREQNE